MNNFIEPQFLNFLSDNNFSGNSKTITDYEESLRIFFNSKFSLALSSGTAAIVVALKAVGIEPGDEVILTPTCPLCTVYPILSLNAIPVFCDTNPDNFSLDLSVLKNIITKKTKCIIDIPMWGYPTPVKEIREFTDKHKIPLIFDLSHAHGTLYEGKNLSEFADISCFSTHSKKILSTGEGGFILTNFSNYYEKSFLYSRFGNLDGENFGLNYKIGALQAALGMYNLKHIKNNIEKRIKNSSLIRENIYNKNLYEFPIVIGGKPNYYRFIFKINNKNQNKFIDYLFDNGISSDIKKYNCKPLYNYKLLKMFYSNCENAVKILKSITTIDISPEISEESIFNIIKIINNYKD